MRLHHRVLGRAADINDDKATDSTVSRNSSSMMPSINISFPVAFVLIPACRDRLAANAYQTSPIINKIATSQNEDIKEAFIEHEARRLLL